MPSAFVPSRFDLILHTTTAAEAVRSRIYATPWPKERVSHRCCWGCVSHSEGRLLWWVMRQFGLGPLGHGFLGWTWMNNKRSQKCGQKCGCLSMFVSCMPLRSLEYKIISVPMVPIHLTIATPQKTRGPSKGIDWMHVSPQSPHKSPPWFFLWRWFLLWKSIRFGAMVYYGILYKLGSQLELRIEWDPVGHSWLLVLFPFSFAIYFWEWWARRCAYVILIRPKWGHRTF